MNVAAADDTSRLGYTITDLDGLTATAEVTVIVLDNLAPVVAPLAAETEFQTAIDLATRQPGDRRRRRQLYFACCDGTRGRHGDVLDEQRRRAERALHSRRRRSPASAGSPTSPTTRTATPSPGSRDHRAAAGQPAPTATDGTAQAEAGSGDADRPRPVRDRSRPHRRRRALLRRRRSAARPSSARGRHGGGDAADRRRRAAPTTRLHGHRLRRAQRIGEGHRDRHRAERPRRPPPWPTRPAPPRARRVDPRARQRHRPARPRPDDRRRQRQRRIGHGDGVGRPDHVHARTPATSAPPRSPTRSRTPATRRPGRASAPWRSPSSGGPARRRRRRPPPTTPRPRSRGQRRRPTARRSPTSSCRHRRGSARSRSGSPAATPLTGLVNGRPYRFQVRAAQRGRLGRVERVLRARHARHHTRAAVRRRRVAFGDGQLTVNWPAPANEGRAITGYEVEIGGGRQCRHRTAARPPPYVWDGPAERHQLPVPGRRRSNAAGRSEPSPWSDPSTRCASPTHPARRVVQRGNRYLDLSWAPSARTTATRHRVPGARCESNPGAWVPVGAGTSYRWSEPAQRRRRSSSRCGRATATPTGASTSGCVGGGQPVRRARRSRPHPTAARGDGRAVVTYTAPGDQGCAITGIQVDGDGWRHAAPPASAAHVHRPEPTARRTRSGVRAQNEVGWGAWSAASNAVMPAGVADRARIDHAATSGVGGVDAHLAGRQRQRQRRSRATRSRSTAAADGTSGSRRRYARAGLSPTARRTRSRCGPATTSSCGAWSPTSSVDDVGRARPARRTEASAGDGNDLGASGARRPPTARRSTTTRSTSNRAARRTSAATSHVVERHQRHELPGPRPGVQRRRLRAVERVEPVGHPEAPPPRSNVTASYYGDAQGQPGCGSSRCVYVRVDRHRACSRTPPTP